MCKERAIRIFVLPVAHSGVHDTFLLRFPLPGAFDLLVYTDKDLEVPEKWEESGPQIIHQSETVRLRSFNTLIHKVNSTVAYKVDS